MDKPDMGLGKPDIGPFLMGIGAFMFVWGLAGWLVPGPHAAHLGTNLFNTLFGVVLFWSGFGWSPNVRHHWARNVGVVLLALGVVGLVLVGRGAPSLWLMHLETLDGALYVAIGVLLVLGGLRLLTEDVYLVPRRYRRLMATRAVEK